MNLAYKFILLGSLLVVSAPSALPAQERRMLRRGEVLDTVLSAGASHEYALPLRSGESAFVTVLQNGVDVIVEVRDARDSVLFSVDSPNGRSGDEPVEIVAERAQRYILRVRPFDPREPAGRYRLTVNALRTRAQTRQLLGARKLARDSATSWLVRHGSAVPAIDQIPTLALLPSLDDLARRARVLGLGEATHGSRELNDARFAITRRLVEQHGYRLIAIEASALRLSERSSIDAGWIGRRIQRELVDWVRAYNAAHPDDSVRVAGVDAQDFATALPAARSFISKAYGSALTARWDTIARELAAADSQAAVFGNSRVDRGVRDALFELVGLLQLDRALLVQRFGAEAVEAIAAIEYFTQFADYNSGTRSPASHGRDWYMAANLLKQLQARGPNARAVLWQHNAHAAKSAGRTTGGFLDEVLGCGYAAIALTFGRGAFVAQIPNDQQDRLAVSSLPDGPDESIEGVLAAAGDALRLAAWPCDVQRATLPRWLQIPQRMHWVGALFTPGTPAWMAFQPFDLVGQFDGILYIPAVTAEDVYLDRPTIPRRP
ncbi:MAG TPA: erythromycin esterase family protein [Longimicrobiales bacterium]